jgi:hypothetical protein
MSFRSFDRSVAAAEVVAAAVDRPTGVWPLKAGQAVLMNWTQEHDLGHDLLRNSAVILIDRVREMDRRHVLVVGLFVFSRYHLV